MVDISSVICSTSVSGLNNPFGLCFSTHFVLLYVVDEEDELVSESDDDCLSGADMIMILNKLYLPTNNYNDQCRGDCVMFDLELCNDTMVYVATKTTHYSCDTLQLLRDFVRIL